MKGSLAYLRAAVIGFALFAGGRALYQNRDTLRREWQRMRGTEGLKGVVDELSLGKVLGSVGSLKNLANQFNQLKRS